MNNFRFKRGLFTAINGQFKDQIHNYISSSSDSFVSHWFGIQLLCDWRNSHLISSWSFGNIGFHQYFASMKTKRTETSE